MRPRVWDAVGPGGRDRVSPECDSCTQSGTGYGQIQPLTAELSLGLLGAQENCHLDAEASVGHAACTDGGGLQKKRNRIPSILPLHLKLKKTRERKGEE